MSDVIIPMIFIGIPWTLGWIAKSHWNHQQFMKVLQLKAEMNSRLLDRAGADASILELLKSDVQQHMFEVKMPEPKMPAPYMRMLTAIQISLILLAGGATCLIVRSYMSPNDRNDMEAFLFFGTLGVALGIGSLLSAGAAFLVARMWHTLNNPA